MMRHVERTGRQRYDSRRTFWGREYLVLQIQERGLVASYIGGHVDCEWMTRWRDATTVDLTITSPTVARAA